jgi:NAD(P)-dependent dehydrogenase (short-subunit alcohol dehydrogenase family)
MQLKGKVALVTGATGAIGSTIARRLGEEGATVIGTHVSSRAVPEALTDDPAEVGGSAQFMQLDQRSPRAIERCADAIANEHGRLDILVNNAAWNVHVAFPDLDALTPDLWDRVLETNLRGPFLLARACAALLEANGGGHIVNISSSGGIAPIGSSLAYAASKAGLNHLTRCLAVAMAPHVAVNCIASGLVENTRMSNVAMDPAAQEAARRQALLRRTAQTRDIAEQVMTFVTSTSITGQIIAIDGGSPSTMR